MDTLTPAPTGDSKTPLLLHEQTGLRITKNLSNNFCVVTLHYTADPAKRSPAWKKEATQGMIPEKFAREYEIDYTAVMGAKVFPEVVSRKAEIVVPEPYPDFGPDQRYWGGFDYGARNPSSFHVYTLVDGVLYSVWELFKPCKNVAQFAEEMKRFPYWHKIRYIAADPKIWARDQQHATGLVSIQDLFMQAGVLNLVKGSQDEDAWIAMIRQFWSHEEPQFKILGCCPNQLREFESAIYINQSDRQLNSQAYQEKLADVDNHSLDDCKYFMLSRPRAQAQSTGQDPIMVNRWAIQSTRTAQQYAGSGPLKGYH